MLVGVPGWVVGLVVVLIRGPVVEEIMGDLGRVAQSDGVKRDPCSNGFLGKTTGIFRVCFMETIARPVGLVGKAVGEQNRDLNRFRATSALEFLGGDLNGVADVGGSICRHAVDCRLHIVVFVREALIQGGIVSIRDQPNAVL